MCVHARMRAQAHNVRACSRRQAVTHMCIINKQFDKNIYEYGLSASIQPQIKLLIKTVEKYQLNWAGIHEGCRTGIIRD